MTVAKVSLYLIRTAINNHKIEITSSVLSIRSAEISQIGTSYSIESELLTTRCRKYYLADSHHNIFDDRDRHEYSNSGRRNRHKLFLLSSSVVGDDFVPVVLH